jgi:CIC family chloride channel protein
MFAIEVLLVETVISYFIPLIISSVVALCVKDNLQEASLFNFVLRESFNYKNVPYYIVLEF